MRFYYQQYVDGESCSAVYIAVGAQVYLLGVTKQLVGESWLHARRFHYCGSIGPLRLSDSTFEVFRRLGDALTRGCGLRGLFGVDCVLRDGVPWPVEINPRYTASVEVLEHGLVLAALNLHRNAFDPAAAGNDFRFVNEVTSDYVGKAILFARAPIVFPHAGPWLDDVYAPWRANGLPDYADIPHAGELIERGNPILSFFGRGATPAECERRLRAIAADLDQRLGNK
jgi:predicted ATP-grasp superfamily ATP-dependent carboligase